MKAKTKVVYVLGAGFSKSAGIPSQEGLVAKIFEIHKQNPSAITNRKIQEFQSFLANTLNIPPDKQEKIPLEDIFTPLDRCILDSISFRNLNVVELKKKRELIFELIGKTIESILANSTPKYIENFATYLIKTASVRKEKNYGKIDPVSVISTNWDILLDNAIHNGISFAKHDAVVDYCCYISSYYKNDSSVKPGLEVLGRGGFNVKLIKLHGSLNWLQCPRCHRLYVSFNEKIAMNPYQSIKQPSCRHCNKNFGRFKSHYLISNLIMPTFLKDLSNPQYKIIWQNAGIELAEARKIVFIGYSLPHADFEMRQLLSRMVDSKAEIEVVDFEDHKNKAKFKDLILGYEQFFGRKIKAYKEGAEKYIQAEFN